MRDWLRYTGILFFVDVESTYEHFGEATDVARAILTSLTYLGIPSTVLYILIRAMKYSYVSLTCCRNRCGKLKKFWYTFLACGNTEMVPVWTDERNNGDIIENAWGWVLERGWGRERGRTGGMASSRWRGRESNKRKGRERGRDRGRWRFRGREKWRGRDRFRDRKRWQTNERDLARIVLLPDYESDVLQP